LLQLAIANASGRRVDRLRLYYRGELVCTTVLHGPLELGRQQQGEAPPYARLAGEEGERLIVAPLQETTVSRHHAVLAPEGDDQLCVTNYSRVNPIRLTDGRRLEADQSEIVSLPVDLWLGAIFVRIDQPMADPPSDAANDPPHHADHDAAGLLDRFRKWRQGT
jgi:hypothetical protein